MRRIILKDQGQITKRLGRDLGIWINNIYGYMVLDLWIKFGCFVQEPFKKALVRKKEKKKLTIVNKVYLREASKKKKKKKTYIPVE